MWNLADGVPTRNRALGAPAELGNLWRKANPQSHDLTLQQAISRIRKTPRQALHYLYVTNRSGKLIGVVNMRD